MQRTLTRRQTKKTVKDDTLLKSGLYTVLLVEVVIILDKIVSALNGTL